jgi:hypothetical protein
MVKGLVSGLLMGLHCLALVCSKLSEMKAAQKSVMKC